MNIIQEIEQEHLASITEGKEIPDFSPGDTVRVNVKVVEGNRERVQAFEGVCIGRRNAGLNSSFTVRKLSYGEGVERVFPLYSPRVESIEIVRRGKVRRAKLYYLRGRTGKRARIVERTTGRGMNKTLAAKKGGSPAPAKAVGAPAKPEPAVEAVAAAETPAGPQRRPQRRPKPKRRQRKIEPPARRSARQAGRGASGNGGEDRERTASDDPTQDALRQNLAQPSGA